MQIITNYPIYSNACGMCSGIDGSSSPDEIKDFQRFAMSKGEDLSWFNHKLNRQVQGDDGVWGSRTQLAWDKWGKEWEKSKGIKPSSSSQSNQSGGDKKGMSKKTKMAIGIGLLAIFTIGLIVYSKKKKK